MFLDQRLCVDINNSTITNSSDPPLRIVVRSDVRPPMKCIENVNLIKAIINALKVPIVFDFEQTFGIRVGDQWTGAVGHVMNNMSNIAIGLFVATSERYQALAFSPTLWFGSTISIFSGRLSDDFENTDFEVFKTFSLGVWLCLLISIVLVGVTHRFLSEENYGDVLDDILMSFKMLFSQYCPELISPYTLKNIFLFGISLNAFNWLMIWFQTFMLANLLFEPIIQIDSIDDLNNVVEMFQSQDQNLIVVAYKQHLAWHLLESSQEANFRNVFKLLTNEKPFDYQQIYEGKRVAIGFSAIFEYVMEANPHMHFHLSRELYFMSNIVSLYSKSLSPSIRQRVDHVISCVYESGLQDLWISLEYNSPLNVKPKEDNETIEMRSIRGLMVLQCIIFSILVLVLILEIIIHKRSLKIKLFDKVINDIED